MKIKSHTVKKIIHYITVALSVLIILSSFLSLMYDIPKWYLKILDFPRVLEIMIGLILLTLFVVFNRSWRSPAVALTIGVIGSIAIHFSFIYPYLLGEVKVPNAVNVDKKNTFSLLLSNVLIDNKNADKFLDIIEKSDPDMILAMEVNDWWTSELEILEEQYAYLMKYPTDNAYGMNLYSKLPLSETRIEFLNLSEVPSFHAKVTLPSGKVFNFHGMHPVAPMPSKKYPDNIGDKVGNKQEEVELLIVGNMVKEEELPSIVAGDFNDVAWSNTTRLFGSDGELFDVRVGRGLFNTFDATSSFMRWPLDHYYVTKEFAVVDFKRLENFDSDHFPLYCEFILREKN